LCFVSALLLATGCIDYLESGELGRARYFGEVRGAAPLRMLPPISDRDGNVYALYGARELNEVEAFVGHSGGGWSLGCDLHEGDDRGAHGRVGHATGRAWYWSGNALVEVNGGSGNCRAILDVDPASGGNLLFDAVVPLVIEQPSRSTALALIRTAADSVPFHVVVDLDLGRYSDARTFEPAGATDLVVLGVGADPGSRTGMMLVRYQLDGETVIEGLYLDDRGEITARAPIEGAADAAEDAVLGYLQSVDGDRVIGLLETGEVLRYDRAGGRAMPFERFAAAGVHRWDDRLYLVGAAGATPVIASIEADGLVAEDRIWGSSVAAAEALRGTVAVIDERSEPRRLVGWQDPASAIGPVPFLSAHSPDHYAEGTTGWLLAGPGFQLDTNPQTSVAFAPIGIEYP
jgi:hypothetical protein